MSLCVCSLLLLDSVLFYLLCFNELCIYYLSFCQCHIVCVVDVAAWHVVLFCLFACYVCCGYLVIYFLFLVVMSYELCSGCECMTYYCLVPHICMLDVRIMHLTPPSAFSS